MSQTLARFWQAFFNLASAALTITILTAASVHAGDVDVVNVKITDSGENRFHIAVTLKHADEGWDHYANRWDVLTANGETLGSRILAHPHVNEQPFTRSLTVTIPPDIKEITLRGNDLVHEANGVTMTVAVPGR